MKVFSIDNGVQGVFDNIMKGITPLKVSDIVNMLRDVRVEIRIYFDIGFPGFLPQDIAEKTKSLTNGTRNADPSGPANR